MFYQELNPVAFSLFGFSVHYYSLAYVFGFLAALFLLLRKKEGLGLKKDEVYDLVVWLIIGVIVGARAFEILVWNPGYYFANPLEVISFWKGIAGMSYHGGLLGGVIAAYVFCRKKKLDFLRLADVIIIPAALFLAIGRLGNFINNELVGRVTDAGWCFVFPGYEGCRHPQQLYAAGYRFLIFFGLLLIGRKERKPGMMFFSYLLMEGAGRFVVDFFREDVLYLGLSLGQWLSVGVIITAGYFLLRPRLKPGCKI